VYVLPNVAQLFALYWTVRSEQSLTLNSYSDAGIVREGVQGQGNGEFSTGVRLVHSTWMRASSS